MTKAVFPGSFDPPTNGHLNIIKRAAELFDEVDVVIAVNSDKKYLFSEEERLSMLSEIVKAFKNVRVHSWNGLIVEYAEKSGSKVLLRGIRNVSDFSTSGKGGLKILLKDKDSKNIAFIWMRGSGTEPVFRIMCDVKGDKVQMEKELLEWETKLIQEADK